MALLCVRIPREFDRDKRVSIRTGNVPFDNYALAYTQNCICYRQWHRRVSTSNTKRSVYRTRPCESVRERERSRKLANDRRLIRRLVSRPDSRWQVNEKGSRRSKDLRPGDLLKGIITLGSILRRFHEQFHIRALTATSFIFIFFFFSPRREGKKIKNRLQERSKERKEEIWQIRKEGKKERVGGGEKEEEEEEEAKLNYNDVK